MTYHLIALIQATNQELRYAMMNFDSRTRAQFKRNADKPLTKTQRAEILAKLTKAGHTAIAVDSTNRVDSPTKLVAFHVGETFKIDMGKNEICVLPDGSANFDDADKLISFETDKHGVSVQRFDEAYTVEDFYILPVRASGKYHDTHGKRIVPKHQFVATYTCEILGLNIVAASANSQKGAYDKAVKALWN